LALARYDSHPVLRTRRPLRIAQISPLFESVPPRAYGGTERVVSWLTEELVRLGHEVTLFASGDSKTAARLVAQCDTALWQDPSSLETLSHHVLEMERVFRRAHEFDVLHFHTDFLHFPLLRQCDVPAVTTLHGALNPTDHGPLFREYPDVALISISDSQRGRLAFANFRATVYHGAPLDLHRFSPGPGDYLAFLGRASPQKGLDRAIRIAIATGRKLRVAARICPEERGYYAEVIAPLLREAGPLVELVGEVGGEDKDRFLSGARALLFPIDWEEPFGLVMIEALATGTPVIAWRRGSVPEVIDHGRTGFIVEDLDEAIGAVGAVDGLDRRACRADFERRFTSERMARDYLDVYHSIADQEARPLLAVAGGVGPERHSA
jgi:glycosyltransferase involved in cell wall biosynthesis